MSDHAITRTDAATPALGRIIALLALAAALNEHLSAQGVNSVNVNRDVDK